jgi:hypothetical protein
MVLIKDGVTFVYSPGGLVILQAIKTNSKMLNKDLTITSGSDGIHSGLSDPHHFGNAYDVRSHDLDDVNKQQFLANLNNLLARDDFYYFLEDNGTANEHFHIQVRKGINYTIQDFLKA